MIVFDLMGASLELQECIVSISADITADIVTIGGEHRSIRSMLKLGSLTAKDMGGGTQKKADGMSPEKIEKMMSMAKKNRQSSAVLETAGYAQLCLHCQLLEGCGR